MASDRVGSCGAYPPCKEGCTQFAGVGSRIGYVYCKCDHTQGVHHKVSWEVEIPNSDPKLEAHVAEFNGHVWGLEWMEDDDIDSGWYLFRDEEEEGDFMSNDINLAKTKAFAQ